jgi:hypothetical protein
MWAYTITDTPRLQVREGQFIGKDAHYGFGGSQLVVDSWQQTGTLNSDGSKIHWSDGSVWVRTNNGARYCGAAATPTPKPYRYLDFTSIDAPAPVYYVGGWTAVMNNGSAVYACVSFKNMSSVTATQIHFSFLVMNSRKQVVDTARLDRKGEFSPNIEIIGWGSLADWSAGQGHRGYYDNCRSWRPNDEEEQTRYSHLEYYAIRVDSIDYADGTTFRQPPAYRFLQAHHETGAPIDYVDDWTAIWKDGTKGWTCVTFKNTSTVTATRVLFGLKLLDKDEHVVAAGDFDRKGEFAPNAEIRGHTIAQFENGSGTSDTGKNCTLWTPGNESQRLAYPHLQSYRIRVDRIEYADGTTWPGKSESPSPSPAPPKNKKRIR